MVDRGILSVEQCEAALRDIVGSERAAIICAAKLLSSDSATTPLLLALLDTERRVDNRHGILYALSWHADMSAFDVMVRIVSDRNEVPVIRGQAAEGLSYAFSRLATNSARFEAGVNALLEALKDPSPEVRYCAVNALGTTGHPPLASAIQGMLSDRALVPGWVGTVGEEASRALESLWASHKMRLRKKP